MRHGGNHSMQDLLLGGRLEADIQVGVFDDRFHQERQLNALLPFPSVEDLVLESQEEGSHKVRLSIRRLCVQTKLICQKHGLPQI